VLKTLGSPERDDFPILWGELLIHPNPRDLVDFGHLRWFGHSPPGDSMLGPLLSVKKSRLHRPVVWGWIWLGLGLCSGILWGDIPVQAQVGGVAFDPRGEVRLAEPISETELLAARAALPPPPAAMSRSSPLRVISLRRLEAVLDQRRAADGKLDCDQLPGDLRFLAGLHQIDWVFCQRDTNDIWLMGQAGGWVADENGRPVATAGGRPVLELDDLLVALRYAFPDRPTDDFIGCSIDPTNAGLAAVERLLRQNRRMEASRASPVARALEQAAGPQAITIFGIPPETRFAQKLVSADYRLKRLALGHDPAPVVAWKSFPDLLAQRGAMGQVPQQRWWFAPAPRALRVSEDRETWRIDPQPLQVQTARLLADGEPGTPASLEATQFAELATRLLPDVVARLPVFADLQNLLALALAAEIVRNRAEESDRAWRPGLLLDSARIQTRQGPIPRHTPPLAQVRPGKKGAWICTVSGGVELRPEKLLAEAGPLTDEGVIPRLPDLPEQVTQWWWDVPSAATQVK